MKIALRFSLLIIICFLTACSSASEDEELPNILFAIADDQSFPHAGAYGCSWVKTPAFDMIAEEGILFNNAFTPNSKCAPSRSVILTGRNSWQLEAAANHNSFFPAKFKTYAETLIEHGYFVGHTAKGWAPGDPGTINGRKRELVGPAFNKYFTTPPTSSINRNDYAANFEYFLDSKEGNKPFCFWYGSTEPHRGYEFLSGMNKGNKITNEIDEVYGFWPDRDSVRQDMLDYAFEIEYFDQHLNRMIKILEERGLLENTVVIVTADNGMPFPRMKGHATWVSNHLPLAIMWPKGIKNPGRTVDEFVSFADFAPTFLDLANIKKEESGMRPIQGKSLVSIFKDNGGGADHALFGKERTDVGRPNDEGYPVRGIANTDYIYIMNFHPERWFSGNPETGYMDTDASPTKSLILNERRSQGRNFYWDQCFGKHPAEELYNRKDDPYCLHNLAYDTGYTKVKEELKTELVKELKEQNDPRMFGKGDIFDAYPYAPESLRNFYTRYMEGEEIKTAWINDSDYEKEEIENY